MQRRQALSWLGGLGFVGSAGAVEPPTLLAQASGPAPAHDHAAMMGSASPAPAAPRRNDRLIPAFQDCTRTAQTCIAHCQELLAEGDKSLGACLRTALDADAVGGAVLRLAGLNSRFTAALAKQSIPVLQACFEACKEHVEHHVQCKACHDACVKAIAAAKLAA